MPFHLSSPIQPYDYWHWENPYVKKRNIFRKILKIVKSCQKKIQGLSNKVTKIPPYRDTTMMYLECPGNSDLYIHMSYDGPTIKKEDLPTDQLTDIAAFLLARLDLDSRNA